MIDALRRLIARGASAPNRFTHRSGRDRTGGIAFQHLSRAGLNIFGHPDLLSQQWTGSPDIYPQPDGEKRTGGFLLPNQPADLRQRSGNLRSPPPGLLPRE